MHTNMESGNKGTLKKKRQTHKSSHCRMSDGRFMILITFKCQKMPLVSQFTEIISESSNLLEEICGAAGTAGSTAVSGVTRGASTRSPSALVGSQLIL